MTAVFTLDDGREVRTLGAADFPLALGGAGADVALPGLNGAGPAAYLGVDAGDLFIQPEAGAHPPVTCNGTPVTASRWLRAGDEVAVGGARLAVEGGEGGLRLVVRAAGAEGATPAAAALADAGVLIEPIDFRPAAAAGGSRRRRRGWRAPGLALLLAVAALAAAAGYVFTARSVEVRTVPAADRLTLTGGLWRPRLGESYLLRPGRYVAVAEKAGYRRLEAPLAVGDAPHQRFVLELDKLPGFLVLTTVPEVGAEVRVDGEVVGTTPLARLELAAGEHEVAVRARRYRDFTVQVAVAGGGETEHLTAELEPGWAEITFRSAPSGAAVTVDGERLGTTPAAVELSAGSRAVEVALAGYEPYRGRLEVSAGQPRTLPEIRLKPAAGRLTVISSPAGAAVTVDGVYRGETPLELALAPGAAHRLSASKAGFAPAAREVRVGAGESAELALELAAREGEVEVVAWPADAELVVDGEPRGPARQTLRLPAVPHRIEIRKAGYPSHTQTVTPLPGIPQSLEVTLRTPEETRAAATPRVLAAAEEHELRLIAPGRFRMGASRREPGRRANEVLREVELTRPYYLGAREVTNRQFRRFHAAHLSGQAGPHNLEVDHHPAVRVSWQEAAAYCNWLSAQEGLPPAYVQQGGGLVAAEPMTTGYRLPTEAEWAWAARFPDGRSARKYPWGDALPIAPRSGNYADAAAAGLVPATLPGYSDGFAATAPVDAFPADARGLYGLGGNVAEWIHDVYTVRPPVVGAVERDPRGPPAGASHAIRGASWMSGSVAQLRWTYRDEGAEGRADVGFRVARYAE